MNEMGRYLFIVCLVFTTVRCGTTTKTTASAQSYSEDLTVFRPPVIANESLEAIDNEQEPAQIPQSPEWDITYKLDSLLDSISVNNQKKKFIQGYTIQVYTGSSRKEANVAITDVYSILPGRKPKITYDLPNYKVKVGKFYHRLAAQRDFASIRRHYKNAILVPQQFSID